MISWEKYLSIFVDITREAYNSELAREGVTSEYLLQIFDNPAIPLTLPKPCQIILLEFPPISRMVWIVTFEKNKPDKDFKIVEKIKESPKDFAKSHTEYKKYNWILHAIETDRDVFQPVHDEEYVVGGGLDHIAFLFFSDPRETSTPQKLALHEFYRSKMYVLRSVQQSKIEKSTIEITNKVKESKTKAIPSILKDVKSIEESLEKLKKIDEHEQKLMSMKEDLIGVRKLVGTKTFGEWKVLLSEIGKINTRIDTLSDIRDAYDKVLAQQSEVMKQQSSFVTWIKYATILVPIAVICVPIIEILLRHFLGNL